ncbi:hypothetical protein PGTUg99_035258 [Puccinia graminis f. sp. tritici]|uniref:Uncharacterized protein n=1 Tax=Puccinia graminis f. sp. tritici TaxID=56615 RepID=A0A5B0SMQ1_PUCGR|nr:hypothetical protein PGTUg99_035258 [Puccinia graminis f. sp. tritici]
MTLTPGDIDQSTHRHPAVEEVTIQDARPSHPEEPQLVGAMRHFTLFGGRTGFSGAKKFHAHRGRACAAPAHRRASGSAPSTLVVVKHVFITQVDDEVLLDPEGIAVRDVFGEVWGQSVLVHGLAEQKPHPLIGSCSIVVGIAGPQLL